jgi:hypothetical protein
MEDELKIVPNSLCKVSLDSIDSDDIRQVNSVRVTDSALQVASVENR